VADLLANGEGGVVGCSSSRGWCGVWSGRAEEVLCLSGEGACVVFLVGCECGDLVGVGQGRW
jgi:hypothetical protein